MWPNVIGIAGAVRGSLRLHWTRREACLEAEGWVAPCTVKWQHLDAIVSIGRLVKPHIMRPSAATLVVRGMQLPLLPLPPPRVRRGTG